MKYIIWIFIIIALAFGIFYFTSQETDTGIQSEGEEVEIITDDEDVFGEPVSSEGSGTYEAYAPEKLAMANEGDVVLFFRASWCPTCKALDANIRGNLSAIPRSLTILDVDYDNSTALKQKYGVTYQHTLVQVDANGNLIKKWSGSPTLAALAGEVI